MWFCFRVFGLLQPSKVLFLKSTGLWHWIYSANDSKAAEKNIAASMEVEKSARADLKPKLSGTANFQYTENPLELTLDVPSLGLSVRTVEGRQLNYGGSLSILQPVYTGGTFSTGIHPYGTTSAIICRQSGKGIE